MIEARSGRYFYEQAGWEADQGLGMSDRQLNVLLCRGNGVRFGQIHTASVAR